MTKKKILGIFSRKPLIWLHYFLLDIIIILTFYWMFPSIQTTLMLDNFTRNFIILYLVISISDQLIHKILGVD